MNPRVKTVEPCDDYTLHLIFDNGEKGVFDCAHLLDFGVFREFRDLNYFKQAAVAYGTVVWPHEQDICPDTLYLTATGKNDQLMVAEEQGNYTIGTQVQNNNPISNPSSENRTEQARKSRVPSLPEKDSGLSGNNRL
jgi:hypothetical protein